jgi:pimeloyl-ACP methyl ester carboxylesterase
MYRAHHAFACAAIALVAGGACVPQDEDKATSPAPSSSSPASASAPAASRVVADDSVATADLVEATAARFVRRGVDWAPCQGDPELLCSTLVVPLDYHDPRGPTLALAVIKAPATGRKRGSIFANPGGPGGSGVDFVQQAKALFTQLRQSFDIVSFDPRGTGRSSEVTCEATLPPPPSSDSLEARAAVADETSRRIATSCSAQNGALTTLVGTTNVARDIDVFRAALGEPELNYLGYSYGTILGAEYATQFPRRVRAMVLDGNVPPLFVGDYLLEIDAEGSASAEQAFHRLDQLCRRDSQCPLREAGVVKTFDRLVAKLDRDPVVDADGTLDGAAVRELTFSAMYVEAAWPLIVQVLAAADAGDLSQLPRRPPGTATLQVPGGLATICDDSSTRRAALDYLPQQAATNESYPRFGGANFGIGMTACAQWPAAERVLLRNTTTANPIVLIGNDYDPATPMSWSRNMSAALRPKARLVRYQGGGHTIYGSGSACIDGAVNAYFRDLVTPERGLTCPAVPLSFAANRGARRSTDATMSAVLRDVTARSLPRVPQLRPFATPSHR